MRHAMSMIELVIAIVVMGIVVASLPTILLQTQNNNAYAMQQEAILATKAKIGEILTYDWDEKSYDTNASRAFVLDTTSNADLNRFIDNRRIGHIQLDGRRRLSNTNTTPTASGLLGSESGDLDDIDDFNGDITTLTLDAESAGSLDYVFDLNLSTAVTYASDTANFSPTTLNNFAFDPTDVGTITNIKTITVTATSTDGSLKTIILRAFTSNIGESTPLPSRPYQ